MQEARSGMNHRILAERLLEVLWKEIGRTARETKSKLPLAAQMQG